MSRRLRFILASLALFLALLLLSLAQRCVCACAVATAESQPPCHQTAPGSHSGHCTHASSATAVSYRGVPCQGSFELSRAAVLSTPSMALPALNPSRCEFIEAAWLRPFDIAQSTLVLRL